MTEPIQVDQTHQSKSKPNEKAEEEARFDVTDFQAKLDTSLGNLYRMVDSWIPTSLRTTTPSLSSRSFEPLKPALQPRLGIGAKPRISEASSSNELRKHLLKRKSSERSGEEIIGVLETEEKEEEEESRTTTLFGSSSKKVLVDRFLPRSAAAKSMSSVSGGLEDSLKVSKKQLKKRRKLEKLSGLVETIGSRIEENDEGSSTLQTELSTSMRTTPDTEPTPSLDESSEQSISLKRNDESSSPKTLGIGIKKQKSSSMITKPTHSTSLPSTPESDPNSTHIPSNPLTLSKKQLKKQRNKAMKKQRKREQKAQEEAKLLGVGPK